MSQEQQTAEAMHEVQCAITEIRTALRGVEEEEFSMIYDACHEALKNLKTIEKLLASEAKALA